MKRDALGKKIVIGNIYGFSVDHSWGVRTTIGKVVNETEYGITLEIIKVTESVYFNHPDNITNHKAKVSIKSMKLFPVKLEDI